MTTSVDERLWAVGAIPERYQEDDPAMYVFGPFTKGEADDRADELKRFGLTDWQTIAVIRMEP